MKKEYVAAGVLGLFIFGYVLDFLAGPLPIVLNSPFAFFTAETLSQFPFTAVSIVIKTIGVSALILLLLSFMQKKFFTKALIIFCLAALLELYSIQQMSSGIMRTPLQWILTMTAAGIVLLLPTVIFIALGIIHMIMGKMPKKVPKAPLPPLPTVD